LANTQKPRGFVFLSLPRQLSVHTVPYVHIIIGQFQRTTQRSQIASRFLLLNHAQTGRTHDVFFKRRTISLRCYFFRIFQSSFFRGRQLPPEAIISSHFSRHPLSERQTRAIKGHTVLARLDPTDFRGEALIVVI
jgi:hypothetical protein